MRKTGACIPLANPQFEQDPPERSGLLRGRAALLAAFILGAICATLIVYGVLQRPVSTVPPQAQDDGGPLDQKPFYTVDKRTLGPLTLEELQINIPADLGRLMTAETRDCFVRKIGELAAQAGDPEGLDPADVAFLPTDGSWDDLTFYGRRGLLAQAIVSRAITLC